MCVCLSADVFTKHPGTCRQVVFAKVPPSRPCSKIKSCAQKENKKKHTYNTTENMADKVSWISFILTKHALESQLADAEGEKLQSANVIIKYLCCKQMPNALSDSIIKYYYTENTKNGLDIHWVLSYLYIYF